MVIDGAVVSTVHVYEVAGARLRVRLRLDAERVRAAGEWAGVRLRARAGREGEPSSEQTNVALGFVSVNEKLAEVWFVGFAGCAVIVGAGGGVP